MDKDLERALALSLLEQGDRVETTDEDEDLQKVLKISKENTNIATSYDDQLRERRARMKRRAEEDLRPGSIKRSPSESLALNIRSSSSSPKSLAKPLVPSVATSSKVTITYPDGALRITRTPGRLKAKNCVNLEDVIHKNHLVSACVFSFFIGENELYNHLPLSHSSNAVPIYIGRDANMDPFVEQACNQAGVSFKEKLGNKQLQNVVPFLRQLYTKQFGKNYHAFYAWSPGSSHSKMLLLEYPDFLRLVITSCNMMDIDTVLGDNHWYIHDLPKLASRSSTPSSFETGLMDHLRALSTPDSFLDRIRRSYDYSSVRVHLVTSAPGVCSGVKAEKHGLLRLRHVIKDLDLKLAEKRSEDLQLEVCAASIGNLSARWLSGFNDCALGKTKIAISSDDCDVPNVRLYYPSGGDVKKSNVSAQEAASNIGCHTRPWDNAPVEIKNIFHHYESKDTGCLFHQKLIMAYNPRDPKAAPYYVYIGSANLSQSAWGALEQDKKSNEATCNTKLVKMSNFECGVVVPGAMIKGLLETGTEDWHVIVPYVQDGKRYDLKKDRPWNDPRWVQNYQEDWQMGSSSK